MVSMTLAIPEELKKEMDRHPEMNWSEIARQAFKEKLDRDKVLAKMDEILKNSKLTEKDALMLGRKVNKAVAKKYMKMLEMTKLEASR